MIGGGESRKGSFGYVREGLRGRKQIVAPRSGCMSGRGRGAKEVLVAGVNCGSRVSVGCFGCFVVDRDVMMSSVAMKRVGELRMQIRLVRLMCPRGVGAVCRYKVSWIM